MDDCLLHIVPLYHGVFRREACLGVWEALKINDIGLVPAIL
jgi:hypothetical protein